MSHNEGPDLYAFKTKQYYALKNALKMHFTAKMTKNV